MWPFSHRNPETQVVSPQPKECDHKWTDVRDKDGNDLWYIEYSVDGRSIRYKIIEPYVCIHCKKRKDVILDGPIDRTCSSNDEAWKHLESIYSQYPNIKARAIVEDAVNDLQLVDRNYLRIAANVMGLKF